MNQIGRYYKIEQLLNDRRVVSFQTLMAELEISRATLKRDLAYLRDRLNAPIVHDRLDHLAPTLGGPHELSTCRAAMMRNCGRMSSNRAQSARWLSRPN